MNAPTPCPCCGQPLPIDEELRIDAAGFVVRRGQFAALTGQQHTLFNVLVAAGGQMVSREHLHASLYAVEADEAEIKIIDVQICKLRSKLEPLGLTIQTVWGRGYRFATGGKTS